MNKIPPLVTLSVLLITGCSVEIDKESELFNGKDLSNWDMNLRESVEDVWMVKDGNIYTVGNPWGYISSKESYSNYVLHVEWRWIPGLPVTAKRHNSGVFLHIQGDVEPGAWPNCFEAQLASGMAGSVIHMGTTSSNELTAKLESGGKGQGIPRNEGVSENPLGEWNRYDIICDGDTITIFLNDVIANSVTGISQTSGKIGLQCEGAAVEFRNITLEPLE